MTAPGWGNDPPPSARAPRVPDADGASGDGLPPPTEQPPGAGIFSLEHRRAPGLYLVAWLLAGAGLLLTFLIAPQASNETAGLALFVFGLVLTTLGFAAGAGSQVLERQDRRPDRYRGPSPVLTFLTYFFAVSLIGFLAIAIGWDGTQEPFAFLVIATIQAAAYVVVVWLFAVRSGALSWAEMGWPTWGERTLRDAVGSVLASALLTVPVTFGILVLGGVLALLLDAEAPDILPAVQTSTEAVAVALAAALVVPIGEEVLFRGLAVTAWRRDLGDRSALVRSSVFFAIVHLLNIPAADAGDGLAAAVLTVAVLLPVGFWLGYLFLRRGLLAAITGHAAYNLIVLLGWLASTDALG
jgi:membrane protease YdiL (CAAX protease family)